MTEPNNHALQVGWGSTHLSVRGIAVVVTIYALAIMGAMAYLTLRLERRFDVALLARTSEHEMILAQLGVQRHDFLVLSCVASLSTEECKALRGSRASDWQSWCWWEWCRWGP